MATPEKIIDRIDKLVQESAEKFNSKIPGMQQNVLDELTSMLKELDVIGDVIKPSVQNLKLIGRIIKKLEKVIVDADYKQDVKEYVQAFKDISFLQNQYFSSLEKSFRPTPLLQAIREDTINSVVQNLTGAGMKDSVLGPIRSILKQNITTGGSYKDLTKTLTVNLTDTDNGEGILSRNIKTTVITSVAQYSREYSQTVGQGLQFEWYQYVGSTMETTRCFCHAMLEKRYFHKSEIPAILKGNFPEYERMTCKFNSKTGLPEGMIKGTNVSNFMTNAGGWNCQHSIFPVPALTVPADIRSRFESA